VRLHAGLVELREGDDGATLLRRVEEALERVKRASEQATQDRLASAQ
jgi:hemerythrin-like domain-containing protein